MWKNGVFVLCLMSVCCGYANDYPVRPVPFTAVDVADGFWRDRLETNRLVTVWYAFKKCEETGRVDNFAKAAKMMPGRFRGTPFDDSDVYKVIEGASYCLATAADPKLDAYLDDLISKIATAQEPDGYLYTARTIHPDNPPGIASPKRWLNDCGGLKGNYGDSHELYNVGHLYEAAVAHFQATGKRTLLNVAIKSADLVCSVWGKGKLNVPSGHPEIELALAKLYRVTGKHEYLELSRFLLECRGRGNGIPTTQYSNHKPVVEQEELVGHAVRSVYMACSMADVAAMLGDPEYRYAVDALWLDMATHKMALTGGLGARHGGEAMGDAYELPNAESYNETCAGIANALWNHRMFLLTGEGKYLDLLERVTYNGALSGVSLSGDRFFYVNPLSADSHQQFNQGHSTRFPWTGCACCPVNITRFIPSVPGFAYATRGHRIYAGFYLPGTVEIALGGEKVKLRQTTDYPWKGRVRFEVLESGEEAWELKLRIPGWAHGKPVPTDLYQCADSNDGDFELRVNGKEVNADALQGFAGISRKWARGDTVELVLPMDIRRITAHKKIEDNRGRMAVERGPLVYCLEGVDNNGNAQNLCLPKNATLKAAPSPRLLGGVTVLKGEALKTFYREDGSVAGKSASVTAVPYYAWSNRGSTSMEVWLPLTKEDTRPTAFPTPASRAKATASHTHREDTTFALNDQVLPDSSGDSAIPRFTWWDHKGTTEWVQYDCKEPEKISAMEVYWYDDRGVGSCRVPESVKLTWFDGDRWQPLKTDALMGMKKDCFNKVSFKPVTIHAVRLEVKLQPEFSGGILEWRMLP